MKKYFLICFLFSATWTFSQTAPTAQTLPFSQNFGTSTFSVMPTGTAAWTVTDSPIGTQSLAESSAEVGNASITVASSVQSTGGTYGYSTSSNGRIYIQTSSNGTNGTNQLAAAIVTTNLQNIKISYDIELISVTTRTIGVILQYRIGTTGNWTTVSGTAYSHNSSDRSTGQIDSYSNIELPVAINNKSVVQLRWATWRGSESGNSSGIAIDNISVSASTINYATTSCNTINSLTKMSSGSELICSQVYDNGTNVGIGTNNPNSIYKLDIAGNTNVTGNITTSGNITANSVNTSNLNITGLTSLDSLHVNSYIHTNKIYASAYSSNSPLIFEAPAGTERMRIDDNNGNVGIGTNSPQTKLHVYGNENDVVALRLQRIFSGQGIPATTWDMEALSGKLLFKTPDYSNSVFSLTKTGKAGVGTDSPLANFHIKGFTDGGLIPGGGGGTGEGGGTEDPSSLSAVLRIEDNVINSNNNRIVSWDYTVSGLQQKMLISNNVNGSTNYVMTFKENGDCGIGTTTPGAKLDIAGNLKVSSLAPTTGTNIVQVGTNGILTSTPFADAGIGLWQQSGNDIFNTNTIGNVGIGTNTSTAKLSIEGNSTNNAIVNILDTRAPSLNPDFNIFQIQKYFFSNTPGSPPELSTCFSITDTGNVSIGVYIHNQHPTPIQKLEVWGAIKISSAATTTPSLGTIEYNNGDFFGYTAIGKKALRGPWSESPTNVNNIFYNGGNVGIGTNNPQSALHIVGNVLVDGSTFKISKPGSSGTVAATFGFTGFSDDFYISNIPSNLLINAQGNIGIGIIPAQSTPTEKLEVGNGFNFSLRASDWSSEDAGDIIFKNQSGTTKARIWSNNSTAKGLFLNGGGNNGSNSIADLTIDETGKIGIGTIMPTSKLQIFTDNDLTRAFSIENSGTGNFLIYGNGDVYARSIHVKVGTLGDFVFNENYKLLTIFELENYIKQNHHLPGIPSAKEVKENGMDVGEFQNLLLQKTEEQAIYIITLQKQIDELKKIILNEK